MDNRHSQLVLISKKVEAANDTINEIISKLGWNREELKQWHNEQDLARPKTTAKIPSKTSSLFFYQDSSSVISFIEPTETQYSNRIVDDINQFQQQQQHDKCQAYDQIIHRSNQLRQLYHHHGTNKQTSKIDDIVHQDQKLKKKRKQQESQIQQQQDKRKRAKYRVKITKMNNPIEIQRDLILAYMQAFNKHS